MSMEELSKEELERQLEEVRAGIADFEERVRRTRDVLQKQEAWILGRIAGLEAVLVANRQWRRPD